MPAMSVSPIITIERVAARFALIVAAVILLVTGLVLLTSPLWIPITVGLWLVAAAVLGVMVWGPLPYE